MIGAGGAGGATVGYRVLGPFQVVVSGQDVTPGGVKRRVLLAVLLTHANRAVGRDSLVAALWGDAPPASAHNVLQTYVADWRRLLEPGRAPRAPAQRLVSVQDGYRLLVVDGEVDAQQYAACLAAAGAALDAGDPAQALTFLDLADGLVRGAPLAGMGDLPAIEPIIAALSEAIALSAELRAAACCADGHPAEALPALQAAVQTDPLRESLRGWQIRCLAMAGRQADALLGYDDLVRRLAAELGVPPTRALRDLHAAVLRQGPLPDAALPPAAPAWFRAVPRPGSSAQPGRDAGAARAGSDAASGPGADAGSDADGRAAGPEAVGAGADRPPAAGTARPPGTVTFVAVDDAGSPAQVMALGDARAAELRTLLDDLLGAPVAEHGGAVVAASGAGLLAAFASALDALDYAAHVQRLAARYNTTQPPGRRLGLRAGVHTGEPLVDGSGRWFGVAVVSARELRDTAEAGQVLVSPVTGTIVRDRGQHLLRTPAGGPDRAGRTELEEPTELVWTAEQVRLALPGWAAQARTLPPGDRAEVRAHLARLVTKPGSHVVALSGPAGCGLTTVAAAAARAAAADGAVVLACRAGPDPTAPAQPVVDALRPWVDQAPIFELRLAAADPDAVLAAVLPRLAARLGRPGPEPTVPSPAAAVTAVVALVRALARDVPTLLVLDDLHRADPATRAVLAELADPAGQVPDQRLVVLVTLADTAVVGSALPPGVEQIALAPLEPAQAAALYRAESGRPLAPGQWSGLSARTGGWPGAIVLAAQQDRLARLEETVRVRTARAVDGAELSDRASSELADGVVQLRRLRRQVALGPSPAGPTRPPYLGLQAFTPDDADLFFGREEATARLVARVATASLVAIVAPSGAGKSSLLGAGLLGSLRGGAIPGSEGWPLVLARPGRRPVAALARALAEAGEWPAAEVRQRLQASSGALRTLLDELARQAPSAGDRQAGSPRTGTAPAEPARAVLVVDQLEELFAADPDEAAWFVELLASEPGDLRSCLVLALRADFYDRALADPGLATILGARTVGLPPMTAADLLRAVEEPAAVAGCRLQDGLADLVLEDVAGEPGGLPLLSTALLQTWRRRDGTALTVAGYQAAGGVAGALARLGEEVWADLDERDRARMQDLLVRMAQASESGPDVRRPATFTELGAEDPSRRRVLDVLAARRLVTLTATGAEVAHEALLRDWPRLAGWLAEDRDLHARQQALAAATAAWLDGGRDRDLLLRGVRLAEARELVASRPDRVTDQERALVEASEAASAVKLERARRINRRLRLLVGCLAATTLVAAGLGLVAAHAQSVTRHQARIDSARALAGDLPGQRADRQALLAAAVTEVADLPDTRSAALLARQAQAGLLGLYDGGPHVPVTYPTAGQARIPAYDRDLAFTADDRVLLMGGEGLVAWDLAAHRQLWSRAAPYGSVRLVAATPAGLLAVSADGTVRRPDPATGEPGPALARLGAVSAAAVSPDGRLLAVAGGGSIRLARLSDGTLTARVPSTGTIYSLQLAAGGTQVVAAGDAVRVYAVATGAVTATAKLAAVVGSVALSGDGTRVVAGSDDRRVTVLALPGLDVVTGTPGHLANVVRSVAFGSDDSTVAAVAGGDHVVVFRTTDLSRELAGTPLAPAALLRSLAFSADRRRMAGWGDDGLVRVWDATATPHGTPLVGHTDWVNAVVLAPDGTVGTGSGDGNVAVWRPGGRAPAALVPVRPVAGPAAQVTGLASVAGARRLLVAVDSRVYALDPGAAGPPTPLSGTGHAAGTLIRQLVADRAGQWAASGGTDGAVVVWDVAAGAQAARLQLGSTAIRALAFDPTGRLLAVAAADGRYLVLDRSTGTVLRRATAPVALQSLDWSPDGGTLAVGRSDGTVDLVDPQTLAVRRTLAGQADEPALAVAFRPDGRLLAAGDALGGVTLYDPAGGQLVARLAAGSRVQDLVFAADGRTLVSAGADDGYQLWDVTLDVATWRADACRTVGRGLTPAEWTAAAPGAPYVDVCGAR